MRADDSSTVIATLRSAGGAVVAASALGFAWYLLVTELARRYVYLTGLGALLWGLLYLGGRWIAFFASDQRRRTGILQGVLAAALAGLAIVVATNLAHSALVIPSRTEMFGRDGLSVLRQYGPPLSAAAGGIAALRSKWQVINRRVSTTSFVISAVVAIVLAGTVVWRSDAPVRTTPLFDDDKSSVRTLTKRPNSPTPGVAPITPIQPGDQTAPVAPGDDLLDQIIKGNAEAFEREQATREYERRVERCQIEKADFLRRIDAVSNQTMYVEELTRNARGEFFELKVFNVRPDSSSTIAFEWNLIPIGQLIC